MRNEPNRLTERAYRPSGGRIGLPVAKKLTRLAEELERIDSERVEIRVGSARGVLREITSLTTSIGMAARFAAQTTPVIQEKLDHLRRGKKRRSADALISQLQMHMALVAEHPKEVGALLPKSLKKDVARLEAALEQHSDHAKLARDTAEAVATRRAAILTELRTIAADVRALAAILFRNQPELARQFLMPKRRAHRTRTSRTAAAPPGPA